MARSNLSIDLYSEVGKIMDDISDSCNGAMEVATEKAAKFSVKELKKFKTNKSHQATGKYSSGWTYAKKGLNRFTVHNKKYYQLTHLLENGHDIIRNGRKVGYSAPIKHIKPVEEATGDAIDQYLFEELKKRGM